MKNIIKNIKNAVVNFFTYIFLGILKILEGILYILKGANYIFTCFFQYWPITLAIILIICMLCYPVRL